MHSIYIYICSVYIYICGGHSLSSQKQQYRLQTLGTFDDFSANSWRVAESPIGGKDGFPIFETYNVGSRTINHPHFAFYFTLGVQHHWEQRVLVEPPLFAMGVWPPRPGSLAHRTSFFTINPGCSPSALPNSYRTQNQTQRVKYFRMLPSQKNGGSAAELTCCNYTVVQ